MEAIDPIVNKVRESEDKELRSKSQPWVGIIIHHTGAGVTLPTTEEAWKKLGYGSADWLSRKDKNFISAHFVIHRDGTIEQLVDPRTHKAWHAGVSSYFHPISRSIVSGWNSHAIGIEMVGDGNKIAYTDQQYASLIALCRRLMQMFPTIESRCIVGHENIAPTRKVDPGQYFEWNRFARGIYKD